MRRGFSLVEVMVALCILMISSLAFFRMHQACIQARTFGELLTRAAVLGSSRMTALGLQRPDAPDLRQEWHQDPGNPLADGGMQFFRFWKSRDVPAGREVTLYVAWSDRSRGRAHNFGSEEELRAAGCPRVVFTELVCNPER
jgi:prepilin-type N-terminal cleavage/methylation domain-containing protein